MCGICASINLTVESSSVLSLCSERLQHRGPDYFKKLSVQFTESISLNFIASVLHLRGSTISSLPYEDEYGNLLLWNGEIFSGDLCPTDDSSDTQILSDALKLCNNETEILNVFSSIKGPWACIYFQKQRSQVWFGRDILGRRSLCWSITTIPSLSFSISSVAFDENWKDVICDGFYCLDLSSSEKCVKFIIHKYCWSSSPSGRRFSCDTNCDENESQKIITVSNPIISSPIVLSLNVKKLCCDSFYHNVPVRDQNYDKWFEDLLEIELVKSTVTEFDTVLSESVRQRVNNHQLICKDCFYKCSAKHNGINEMCSHSSVGVLFSGGLDSIVLAALADRHLPDGIPIDLINVAFDTSEMVKNRLKCEKSKIEFNFMTPDRITGLKGVVELRRIRPNRIWNFVEVNVTQDELKLERSKSICGLIHPSSTVLDDSVGCALWFAARGKGVLQNSDCSRYTSPSRILLLGMGADELLAGYSRHRVKYSCDGWDGVENELSLELDRIGIRNLGRDDRIISDHGREARFPFLDENVITFLKGIPLQLIADFNYPRGVGEKLLLRLLAYTLGLQEAAFFAKRAIQFGSRIARCEVSKEKGSDICSRLTSVAKIQ